MTTATAPLTLTPSAWREYAACHGADPEAFAPTVYTRGNPAVAERMTKTAAAREFCQGCPVARACNDYADTHRVEGLWAGHDRVLNGTDYTATPLTPAAPRSSYQGPRPL